MFYASVQDIEKKSAKVFVKAIKTLADKPENLENLESYLSHNFHEWLEKYADKPEKIAFEMQCFADMNIDECEHI